VNAIANLPKVGDVILICEHEGYFYHGVYEYYDPDTGPYISVWKSLTETFESPALVFGPILCGINPPVRSKRWRDVGTKSLERCVRPDYLAIVPGAGGHPTTWMLVRGSKCTDLGRSVPREFQDLEMAVVWSADRIEERIQTGLNVYSYRALMKHISERESEL
jgi:hypothetical protein